LTALTLPPLRYWPVRIGERYEAFSLRERVLVLATLAALSWMLWSFVLDTPLRAELAAAERATANLQTRLEAALALQQELQQQLQKDPNSALITRRQTLEASLATVQSELEDRLGSFVPPEAMPKVLEDLLWSQPGLGLVRLATQAAEPVLLNEAGDASAAEEPALYRHPVRVQLEGGYFDVLAYLEALEASSWRFGWRRLDYRVDDYPRAEVLIELETLSEDRSWLGV